jgi:hypothetical protein
MGLEPFLANLVIASYAEMDDRVWVRAGALLDPAPELSAIRPQDALRSQPLPEEQVWEEAGRRYWEIFGEEPPRLRRGRMVGQFARRITDRARTYQPHAADLVQQLERHAVLLGMDGTDESGRLAIARSARDLLDELRGLDRGVAGGSAAAKQIITAFAGFDLGEVPPSRYGASIKQAESVAAALATAAWDMLKLAPNYGPQGDAVLEALRGAAHADQRTKDLKEALREARRSIVAVIERSQAPASPPTPQPTASTPPATLAEPVTRPDTVSLSTDTDTDTDTDADPSPGARTVRRSGGGRTAASRVLAELRAELAELAAAEPDATIEISWRVVE